MKERGIIFTGESVRAILDGRKTQTRRVCLGAREQSTAHDWHPSRCHYGVPGDRLYVKESGNIATDGTAWMYADQGGKLGPGAPAGSEDWAREWKPRSSMFMPRWASRITLEVVAVRVERLQEITEADAIAEGCEGHPVDGHDGYPIGGSPVDEYRDGWDRINGKRAPWASNPHVWVVSFRRLP